MASLTFGIICAICLFSYAVAFQTQSSLDADNTVRVQTEYMVTFCHEQDLEYNPHFVTFTFNYWRNGCYLPLRADQFPQLYNSLLAALRECNPECPSQRTRVPMPQVTCQGEEVYPNTLAVSFNCLRGWLDPITSTTVSSTATTRRATTTTPTTTSAATTRRMRTTTRSPTTVTARTTTIARRTTTITITTPTTRRPLTTVNTDRPTARTTQRLTAPAVTSTAQSTSTTRRTQSTAMTPVTSPVTTKQQLSTGATTRITAHTPGSGLYELEGSVGASRGFLSVDVSTQACSDLSLVRVATAIYYSQQGVNCKIQNSARALQRKIQSATSSNVLVSQPTCPDGSRVNRVVITYECSSDTITSNPTDIPIQPKTNSPAGANETADMRQANNMDTDNHLPLILGISIPLAILLFILPITVFLVIRRSRERKSLLNRVDEDSYRDPNSSSITSINQAYMDDYGVYHDPALFRKPVRNSAMCQSIQSVGGLYQDPILVACTGPPDALSPIRDAMLTAPTFTKPVDELNDIYVDPDKLDINLDGQPKKEQVYDMPYAPRRPIPPPRPNLPRPATPAEWESKPAYTAMVDGVEPHNYAKIKKINPATESPYYDLENSVQLFESPVYDSIEDLSDHNNS